MERPRYARRSSPTAQLSALLVNGSTRGDDAFDRGLPAQAALTLMPLLHTAARNDALLVGIGTGVRLRAAAEAGFAHLTAVEPNADVVALARRHFAGVNGDVLERPNVAVILDGRTEFHRSRREVL